ncbi:hypothetical protein B484DRAFT_435827 [Ochromonadaceae sp. CCMP2298]|nr:hypothetical protein B484DRAFT_435827 [Ochromonadaceae sp. CCMP2298]|mmetsp:Transcript_9346/g.20680  ORF Transcript_9346/g.20680 Transcript_9346/m.20680 type:complete len:550 (-) Transcript_9346:1631-3280(-)
MLSASWKGKQEEGRAWTEDINRPHEIEVLYQGCKNFWRSGAMVDIILLAHKNYGLIEVVTYAPKVDREAPRLYLNDDILFSLLDTSKCEESLREAKELLLRQHKVPDKAFLMAAILKESKVNYILNRLSTHFEYSLETHSFLVSFEFNWRDRIRVDGAADKLLRDRPRYMKRFVSPHYRSLIQGEVEVCYNNIASDQAIIAELRERAAAAEGRADKVLTATERWRLPMIYMKMLHGRFLGNKDAAIWSKVSKNFKDEDVMVAVKKALEEPLTASPSLIPAVSTGGGSTSTGGDVQDKSSPKTRESHRSPPGSKPSTPKAPKASTGLQGRQKGSSGSLPPTRAVSSSPSLLPPSASTPALKAKIDALPKKASIFRQKSIIARAVLWAPSSTPISGQVEKQEAPSGGLLSFVVCSIKRTFSGLLSFKSSSSASSKIACEDPDIGTVASLETSLETETSELSPHRHLSVVTVVFEHEAILEEATGEKEATLEEATTRRHSNTGAGAGAGTHERKTPTSNERKTPKHKFKETPSATPSAHMQIDKRSGRRASR